MKRKDYEMMGRLMVASVELQSCVRRMVAICGAGDDLSPLREALEDACERIGTVADLLPNEEDDDDEE